MAQQVIDAQGRMRRARRMRIQEGLHSVFWRDLILMISLEEDLQKVMGKMVKSRTRTSSIQQDLQWDLWGKSKRSKGIWEVLQLDFQHPVPWILGYQGRSSQFQVDILFLQGSLLLQFPPVPNTLQHRLPMCLKVLLQLQ